MEHPYNIIYLISVGPSKNMQQLISISCSDHRYGLIYKYIYSQLNTSDLPYTAGFSLLQID